MSALTLSSPCQDVGALLARLQRTMQETARLEASCATYAGSKGQLSCAKEALSCLVEQRRERLREGERLEEAARRRAAIDQANARALEGLCGDRRESCLPGRSRASLRALWVPSQGEQRGDCLLVGRHRSHRLIHRLFLKSSPYLSSVLHTPLSAQQRSELRLPERYAALPVVPIHVDKRVLKRLHHYYCGAPGSCHFSGLSLEELVELYAAARFACDARLERAVREKIEAKIVRAPEGHELLGSLYVASLQVDAAPLSRWIWQQMLACLNIANFYQLCPLLFQALSFHVTLETVVLFTRRLSRFDFLRNSEAERYIVHQLEQVIDDFPLRYLLHLFFLYECKVETPPSVSGERMHKRLLDNLLGRAHAGESSALEKTYLGLIYERGCGVVPDRQEALYWYDKAAEEGGPMGHFVLAAFLSRMLRTSLSLERPEAPSCLAGLTLRGANRKFFRSLKVAADADCAPARYWMTVYYELGQQSPRAVFALVFREVFGEPPCGDSVIGQGYARAMALGSGPSANALGFYYAHQVQDLHLSQKSRDGRAIKAYARGAWGGDREGLLNLSWCYMEGRGCPQDESKAKLFMGLFTCVATPEEIKKIPDKWKPTPFTPQADQQHEAPDDKGDSAANGGLS